MTMSARELQRIEVLTEVVAGRRDVVSGAAVLGISVRQMHRLLARYREGGGGALIHKARGRSSNNQLSVGVREYALELVRQSYLAEVETLLSSSNTPGACARHREGAAGPSARNGGHDQQREDRL